MPLPTSFQGGLLPGSRASMSSLQFPSPGKMSNINFNAPVIRLGTSTSFNSFSSAKNTTDENRDGVDQPYGGFRRNLGLGADQSRENHRFQQREQYAQALPPSKEEVARTIYIGNIPHEITDEALFTIFRAAGSLRRCIRAVDASNTPCGFGFAEYEDAESLGTAAVIFQNLELPSPSNSSIKSTNCKVNVDKRSMNYVEEWRHRRGDDEYVTIQSRVNTAKETLTNVLRELDTTSGFVNETNGLINHKATRQDEVSADIVTIPLNSEDELSDIPIEMREVVAAEIAAFRERSLRRDAQKLQRQELMGHSYGSGEVVNQKIDKPISRDHRPDFSTDSALNHSKSSRKEILSLNGSLSEGSKKQVSNEDNNEEEYGAVESEEEMDAIGQPELEKAFLDNERRWLNREAGRTAAIEREKNRDKMETERNNSERKAVLNRCDKWNDDDEADKGFEEFYRDRSSWIRRRNIIKEQEMENDNRERRTHEYETSDRLPTVKKSNHTKGNSGLSAKTIPGNNDRNETPKFTLSLGAAAQKVQSSSSRKVIAEVEGLLDNEDSNSNLTRRILVPIEISQTPNGINDQEEGRADAIRQLANEIPTGKAELWNWNISWDHLEDSIISEKLKPFIEKKIMEYVGVQEQLLVDVILEHVHNHSSPGLILSNLEGALDEEAEPLICRLWRMIIFYTESDKRGLLN